MSFNGTEGTFITLAEGAAMNTLFRNTFLKDGREVKAVFFGREKLEEILKQTDCMGIRCYFGGKTELRSGQEVVELSLVMVGAKADQNDMLGATDKILDMGLPCPAECSTANPLNP